MDSILPTIDKKQDFARVKALLKTISNKDSKSKKHVTVLGAGIAGLVAAYELEKLGHTVEIIEASPRIGGRIWTHRFGNNIDAPYGELGAMRIHKNHDFVLYYLNEAGLTDKLRPFISIFQNPYGFLDVQDQVERISNYRFDTHSFINSNITLSEEAKLLGVAAKLIIDAISPKEIRDSFDDYLKFHFSDDIKHITFNHSVKNRLDHFSLEDMLSLIMDCSVRFDLQLSTFLRDILTETSSNLYEIIGGMDLLTQNLANQIKGQIKLNSPISQISLINNQVELKTLEHGQINTKLCDYVLCTIPFSVMRYMDLIGFSDQKLEIINTLKYVDASKTLFLCRERFWENKYGIYGGASFSDKGIRQLFYPSDRCNENNHCSPSSVANASGVLLSSYALGDDAKYMASMENEQRIAFIKKQISRFHPEISESNMVTDYAIIDWKSYEWSKGGCCFMWPNHSAFESPMSIANINNNTTLSPVIADLMQLYRTTVQPEAGLFFAGEHCSNQHAWIQGAIMSALSAVKDITSHDVYSRTSQINKPIQTLDYVTA